ncbi:MAG: HGGxSTG domain-containing protein [Hyphomicrobium sp.]
MQRANCQPRALCHCLKCGAKTRNGNACRSPAVRDRNRCRMHGGALGSGAPAGERNGAYRHGEHTREAIAERRMVSALVAECRAMAKSLS